MCLMVRLLCFGICGCGKISLVDNIQNPTSPWSSDTIQLSVRICCWIEANCWICFHFFVGQLVIDTKIEDILECYHCMLWKINLLHRYHWVIVHLYVLRARAKSAKIPQAMDLPDYRVQNIATSEWIKYV